MENHKNYQFSFFDSLIEIIESSNFPKEDFMFHQWVLETKEQISSEMQSFQEIIKEKAVCSISSQTHLVFIQQHYEESVYLLEQIQKMQIPDNSFRSEIRTILELLSKSLLNINNLLENRFGRLMSQNRRLAPAILQNVLNDLRSRLLGLKESIPPCCLSSLIVGRTLAFVNLEGLSFKIDKRALEYKIFLLKTLEGWNWQENDSLFGSAERLVIYMNFNSKRAMNLMLDKIKRQISGKENISDRILILMNYQREFKQLHRKPEVILNPKYITVDNFVNNYFDVEIEYLQNQMHSSNDFNPYVNGSPPENKKRKPYSFAKIKCLLSVDQMALILRSVDEAGLVQARSLSQVYNEIVPFLSSQYRTDLSPAGMRTKSYHPEERDKAIVIEKLKIMIEKVKSC
ncbi:hypothetical protein [Sphingobacterium cellulitidis]|uniref:Uncharacterized protein n=1 Tax=Sphingobacterium cellulitidis TaxID=1768011 RepID=A0A8H9KW04_9SPHI|nr:hypothetical protein [Sphingobacterium soli]MBA8987555.1 hypothetical protein [Sphingobacterium soli]GGE24006.1 hypothetical protein GCM10011516_22080 [Sphingobacterium soli]